jgi:hypothetical protein
MLLLHVMLVLQSLEDLEGERKRSKRGGVYQNEHQLPPFGDASFFGVLLETNTKLTLTPSTKHDPYVS